MTATAVQHRLATRRVRRKADALADNALTKVALDRVARTLRDRLRDYPWRDWRSFE